MVDLTSLENCLASVQRAYAGLLGKPAESFEYEIYRSACVKEFELLLEVTVKVVKRVLREYVTSTGALAEMTFKEVLRTAAHSNLLTLAEVDKWFLYRDIRNGSAHEYGADLATRVITVLPAFIQSSESLLTTLRRRQANKPC